MLENTTYLESQKQTIRGKKKRKGITRQKCILPSFKKGMSIGNTTPSENTKQRFFLAPPSNTRKRKLPENCFRSYIDQIQDGDYSGSKLVKNTPRKTSDKYFIVRTFKESVGSYRRNYSHRSVALYRTKKGGATRANIEYMTASFLEMDGSTDGTIKTLEDVQALIKKNSLPTASYIIQTSPGHYHILWIYDNPLPWTTKGESYWISVQKRYIELFQKGGFLVDKMASLNPCQNLRNPSQLHAFNFKRNCKVEIHKTYQKTSLRAIYRALNRTSIPNPKRVRASVKLRRFSRANENFTMTHKELAETLGTCTKTAQRLVSRAVQNGDIQIVRRVGNNKGTKRATEYTSNLYLEPNSQNGHVSSIKTNAVQTEVLLRDFKQKGTPVGRRQKAIFALGLEIKSRLGKTACIEAIRGELEGGAMRSHVSVREFERTLRNIMKPIYDHPFSLAKMREWDLIKETKYFH